MTAEGEHIPVRVESLDIGYIDGMLCAHTPCSCMPGPLVRRVSCASAV